ncbi:transcriptional regulator [Alcanivorax sp. HI0083]|uniref:Crp/Fnr family transcriptional regulator n=2 Tax=Alcanivorax TaxID=59753 RepID=UPI0007BAB24E|nr:MULTISPECIES: Crp/Fnr family transcriptional regulator [unclassified Alcanivorax]KZY34617.1 transcriptional regulator [Alcanivorax sp. HI0044]KZZ26146.1 transcriptional regulator [Alcanivorax sp. HI0083]
MTDAYTVLRHCPLLAGFPDAALHEAARHARVRSFQANQPIYEKGEPQSNLCVIAEGLVRISSVNAQGQEAVLIIFDSGTWFGDAVFSPGTGRVYGATAHEAAVLVEVPGPFFRELLQRYPQSYPVVLDLISQRLWSAISMIEEDALRGTQARIGQRLLFLSQMQRGGKPEGGPVTVRLTREHIANMMGMTRQGVHRTLKAFEAQGLITLGYGRITIEDEAALREHLATLN